jgi:hypothetical protein
VENVLLPEAATSHDSLKITSTCLPVVDFISKISESDGYPKNQIFYPKI